MANKKEKSLQFPVEQIVVVRRCIECNTVVEQPLAKVSAHASLCDSCDKMENFIEIIGIKIRKG